jgi:hypothetical protein
MLLRKGHTLQHEVPVFALKHVESEVATREYSSSTYSRQRLHTEVIVLLVRVCVLTDTDKLVPFPTYSNVQISLLELSGFPVS